MERAVMSEHRFGGMWIDRLTIVDRISTNSAFNLERKGSRLRVTGKIDQPAPK